MERRGWLVLLIGFAGLSGCSTPPAVGEGPAKTLIEESASAMGGWAAIDAIKTQEIRTGGADWEPLQAVSPTAEAPQINTFGQTTIVDYESGNIRLTFDAKRLIPAPSPVKFVEVISGDAGMLQQPDAQGKDVQERMHPARLATRMRDLRRMPLRLLKTARAGTGLTRVEDRTIDKKTFHILKFEDGGQQVELQLDSFNKLPVRVIYMEDDPIFGDTANELAFSDWKESDGVRQPQTFTWFLNGKKMREEVTRTLINNPKDVAADAFTIPDAVKSQAETGQRVVSQWPLRRFVMGVGYADFARDQKVEIEQLAPGILHVKGSSHHSLAVEMKDHVIVIEAPLYEERSAAVIQAIEAKIPGKPVKTAVITHFHIDHSGGLRTYAAKGATLVAPESIVPWVNDVLAKPHTVKPDALSKAAAKPAVEGVKDVKELTDGDRVVQLRQITNPHAEGMLFAYLPKEKIAFVSDLYSPGAPPDPADARALSFYQGVTAAKIEVDRVAGGHGGVAPFRDLARVMAAVK